MSYATEEEFKMDRKSFNLQIVLGLKTCKTKGDVIELFNEVREHERRVLIRTLEGEVK